MRRLYVRADYSLLCYAQVTKKKYMQAQPDNVAILSQILSVN